MRSSLDSGIDKAERDGMVDSLSHSILFRFVCDVLVRVVSNRMPSQFNSISIVSYQNRNDS